jgi:hypothetical protein
VATAKMRCKGKPEAHKTFSAVFGSINGVKSFRKPQKIQGTLMQIAWARPKTRFVFRRKMNVIYSLGFQLTFAIIRLEDFEDFFGHGDRGGYLL